jgi:hypothetical protein
MEHPFKVYRDRNLPRYIVDIEYLIDIFYARIWIARMRIWWDCGATPLQKLISITDISLDI